MYAVWTLCRANLRKKKVYNGLIALLILLSTLLLATAITVIRNTESIFEDRHREMNGAQQVIMLEKGLLDPETVRDWWSSQEGVSASLIMPFKSLSEVTFRGNKLQNLTLHMMDTPERPFGVDELMFAQGEESAKPQPGTIWIPTSMAYSNDISVGDAVGISIGKQHVEFKVSAVVIDLPFGGPFSTTARIWMNNSDYQSYMKAVPGNEQNMIGLRYDDYSQNVDYWNRFEQFLGSPYLENKITFEDISSFYFIMNKVIGFVMVFLGAVMMLVALYTIGFTISDAILSSYRTIGLLKATGLTSAAILGTYALQYALLSFVSIIPGLLASRLLSGFTVEQSLSSLKTEYSSMHIQGTGVSIVVGFLLFALILLCVWIYANQARKVQPMQAIRFGMSEATHSKITKRWSTNSTHRTSFERWPVSVVIGLRNVVKNIKGSLLMLLLATITTAVLVFGFVLLNSIYHIDQTSPKWGYDSADVSVVIVNPAALDIQNFKNDVTSDPRIQNMIFIGLTNGIVPASTTSEGKSTNPLNFTLMTASDGILDEMGYATLEGRNPRNQNEIALGVNVAKELYKDVGDTLDIYIAGNKHTLIISGIYQAIANMSFSGRVTMDGIQSDVPEAAFINLNDSSLDEQIVQELNSKFGESLSAVSMKTLLDTVFKEAVSLLIIPMSILGLLFIMVNCIIIYSTCRINIKKEARTYGIYKSIGLTSAKVRGSITWGIIVLSALGAILGAVAGVYVLPSLLNHILVPYGIVDLPLILNTGGILVASGTSVLAGGLGCWLASKVIQKTSPRILVVE